MTSARRDALQRTLGDGFRIDRELGGGGMSQVFLATDLALDRQVVVKVLSEELSAGVSAARFRREIQLVARLQHPHVVPLLSAGDAEGALYYVMPFLSGEPLRARMAREGPMAVADVVRILRETLDALAFAHSHGVIHRDIKPENILIGAGHAVVADFGVSKALQDSGTPVTGLTSIGVALGTPAYMAPEQAAADPETDHRADLYAVGVVAYEMLTGAPPFTGTPQQLLMAQLAQAPLPLKQRRSDVPDALATLVMRALEKDPAQRPQTAGEMLAALEAVTTPGGTVAARVESQPQAPLATPTRTIAARWPRAVWIGAAAVVAIGAGATWYVTRPPVIPSAQSLAVTPFTVADGDTALIRLGQNLVTTISANLDGVGEIRVADGTSVLSHARGHGPLLTVEDAVDIAGKLGARSALHGTLTRSGVMVRADASLYDIANPTTPVVRIGAVVHADSVAALTDSLTWGFLREIWASGRTPTPVASSVDTRSPAALRDFLEGERFFANAQQVEAATSFQRAVAADTTFWFAHYRYWLARAWLAMPVDTGITRRLVRNVDKVKLPERLLVQAVFQTPSNVERVRQLNGIVARYPSFVAAHAYLADYLTHHAMRIGHDPRDAIVPWRLVGEMMPGDVNAADHLMYVCMSVGDLPCARGALARFDSLTSRASVSGGDPGVRPIRDFIALALSERSGQESKGGGLPSPGIMPDWSFFVTGAPVLAQQAGLAADIDRVLAKMAAIPTPAGPIDPRWVSWMVNAPRGDLSALDSLPVLAERLPVEARGIVPVTRATNVLLELQGLRTPSPETGTRALAGLSVPGLGAAARAEARWVVAVNGLLRGDSTVVQEQVLALQADTTPVSRIALRSVRALRLGLGGATGAAAESLLVLERVHADSAPKVWGAFSADRLLGAQWLTQHGKPAAADSLLRFTQGWSITTTYSAAVPIAGAAHLQRSRIAEAMGSREKAVEHARIFLAAYDRPSPAAKPWVDEARARITRLGGRVEPPGPTDVPLRPKS